MKGVILGLVAGLVGAISWALLAYFAKVEIAYLALGIGFLVGFAVAQGGETPGPVAGITAVIITVLSLLLGKYAAVEMILRHEISEFAAAEGDITPEGLEEDALVQVLADEVVEELTAAGRAPEMPEGIFDEDFEARDSYPRFVWSEANKRWRAKSPDEQSQMREEVAEQTKEFMEKFMENFVVQSRQEFFKNSFSGFDLLFFGLAIVTAWGVANNAGDD